MDRSGSIDPLCTTTTTHLRSFLGQVAVFGVSARFEEEEEEEEEPQVSKEMLRVFPPPLFAVEPKTQSYHGLKYIACASVRLLSMVSDLDNTLVGRDSMIVVDKVQVVTLLVSRQPISRLPIRTVMTLSICEGCVAEGRLVFVTLCYRNLVLYSALPLISSDH